jgi:hypothetical protein
MIPPKAIALWFGSVEDLRQAQACTITDPAERPAEHRRPSVSVGSAAMSRLALVIEIQGLIPKPQCLERADSAYDGRLG